MPGYIGTDRPLKQKINNTAEKKEPWPLAKCCKYEAFCWRHESHVCDPLSESSGQRGPTRLSYQAKSIFFEAVRWGRGFECACVCAHLCMYVLGWATLPGQALAGMGLVSSLGHWLGGWPSLSSCVSVGCLCFVMEMLFPSNPWTWLEGQQLPRPVKRKMIYSRTM